MARDQGARLLDGGDLFPTIELSLVSGGTLSLPGGLSHPFNVVLINRGAWCPFCVGQLRAFQAGLVKLEAEGIGAVAFSTDPLEVARAMVDELGLTFPVGHSARVEQVAAALGAFYDPAPAHVAPHLQATGFVLGPGHRVITSVYSSGAIGRLGWQDVLGLVQYVKAHH